MAQARLSVRKIREVLRLKAEARLSDREIAAAIGSARSTVQECLRRARAAVRKPLLRGRRIRQARRLAYRVGIHVGAQPDGGSGAVLEHPDDAGLADAFRDVEPQRSQFLGDDSSRARLRKRDLRILMQILEYGGEARRIRIHSVMAFL